jgi:zinc/manganese transport system permease protein
MNWAALEPGILLPALIAGLLVLATHVPLGVQVLDREIGRASCRERVS